MGVWQYSTNPASNTTAADDINWGTGVLPSEVDNNNRRGMADMAEWLDDLGCSITTSGTAGALTAATNGGLPALADGVMIGLVAHTNVSASATLNVDGLGAKPLYVRGSAIAASALSSGNHFLVTYDASVSSGVWMVHGANQLTSGAVTSTELGSGAVTEDKIGTQAVTTSKLATDAVTTLRLANSAVTVAKMQDISQYRWLGRISAGDGAPQVLTADGLLTLIAQATNDCTLQGALSVGGAFTLGGDAAHDTFNTGSTSGVGCQLTESGTVRAQVASATAGTANLWAGFRGTSRNSEIQANGTFGSATGVYGTISDIREKDDITVMPDFFGPLMGFDLRSFHLKREKDEFGDEAPIRHGTIAQSLLQTPLEFAVDRTEDGRLTINYVGLVPLLIQAVQMLDARLRALEGDDE